MTHKFAPDFTQSTQQQRYRLLELSDADRTATTSLTIKNNGSEGAVLCTDTGTYVMKKVETSNALLLVNREESTDVLASLDCYYECVRGQPSMQRLAQLLAEAGANGISLRQLRRLVPASNAEIDAGLVSLRALPLSEHDNDDPWFFVLPSQEAARLLQMAVAEVQLHDDMSVDNVDLARLVDAVAQLEPNRHTVQSLLQHFIVNNALLVDAVALVFARALLDRRSQWRQLEFLAEWAALLPPTVAPLPPLQELLMGIALVDEDEDGNNATLTLFDRDSLSLDASTRLMQMFAKRARWPVAHVEPYLKDVCNATQISKLLSRSARTVTVNGRKYFTHKE